MNDKVTGCQSQWNAPYGGWGNITNCLSLPQPLQSGCQWRFEWFKNAQNPSVHYHRVACPKELTAITQSQRTEEVPSSNPGNGGGGAGDDPSGEKGDSHGENLAQCIKRGTNNWPFLRPFSNIHQGDDYSTVQYCRTDAACGCPYDGPDSVYKNPDSTCDISCNKFCYYSAQRGKIIESSVYHGNYKPKQFFNCGNLSYIIL